jgi:Tn3 transposase DDE domain
VRRQKVTTTTLSQRQKSHHILSNILADRESIGDVQGVEVLKQISPVAWQHINLYGRYEVRKCSEPIDLDDIFRQLIQAPSH